MVAAISAGLASLSPTSTGGEPVTYHWFKMPEFSRETHRRLGQSGAGWTLETICRLVHHVGRVGKPASKKAARELGRLGVGLQAIADEAGISVAKVRRDLVKLVDLGLVAVSRRNVAFHADPATGKIVENRTGRSLPVVVHLTIGQEHCRAKSNPVKADPADPSTVAGSGVPDRDHLGGAIQRDSFKRTPDGSTDGIGRPQTSGQESRLEPATGVATPEPAGRVSGCENASQSVPTQTGGALEGGVVRVDAASDIPTPIGRVSLPAGRKPAPSRGSRNQFPEDRQGPATWDGAAEAARKAMLAETAKRREQEELDRRAAIAAGNLTPRQRAMYGLPPLSPAADSLQAKKATA